MQQRAWEGAPAGNLKEKLGEPGKMDLWKGQVQGQELRRGVWYQKRKERIYKDMPDKYQENKGG